MKASERASRHRAPKQERSRQTVEAVLEGVRRVLQREGASAITTNRVAEAAGVSIGSLYQYFPDKQAILLALYDRHVDEVRCLMERTMADCAASSFEELTRELVEGLANVHSRDGELHELTSAAVPRSADGFKRALTAAFERVLSPTEQERYTTAEAERMLFVLPPMVEALVHGVAQQEQPRARGHAKDEALRAVGVYLRSYQRGESSGY